VRLAIEQGAALVPVVVLGEVDCLRNFISVPRLQAWTYKKLGFPVRCSRFCVQFQEGTCRQRHVCNGSIERTPGSRVHVFAISRITLNSGTSASILSDVPFPLVNRCPTWWSAAGASRRCRDRRACASSSVSRSSRRRISRARRCGSQVEPENSRRQSMSCCLKLPANLFRLTLTPTVLQPCSTWAEGHVSGRTQVDQAAVDKLHARYYAEVARLFEKHKEGFAGYENVQLVFADK